MNYWPAIIVSIYIFYIVVTFGFLYRHGQKSIRHRTIYLFAAIAWPLYWIVTHGLSATVREFFGFFAKLENQIVAIYGIGSVLLPGVYVGLNWGNCSGFSGCLAVLGKSLVWAAVWPSYVILMYLQA